MADIRHIFTQTGKDRISSAELVNELRKLGGQWLSALGSGTGAGPIRRCTFNWLGRQLYRFGIKTPASGSAPDTPKATCGPISPILRPL